MSEVTPVAPEEGVDAEAAVPSDPFALGPLAAALVDYQNLHHYLKGRIGGGSPSDLAAQLLSGLRDRLASDDVRLARGRAYADFGGLDDPARHVQRTLYLHGVEPVYVPATMHRNTTDLQLALDACELRERHPEVGTVALVSGDRDYAPVVQALVAAGRRVVVVAFREHLSPHLLDRTAGGEFVDAADLLPDGALGVGGDGGGQAVEKTEFRPIDDPAFEIDYDALEVIEKFFGHYEEIYLTPLLRRLSDEIGDVEGHDPKSLVSDLEECGAVRLERRRGMPYDYTVLLVNAEHPAVQEVREEVHGVAVVPDEDVDDGLPFEDEAEI